MQSYATLKNCRMLLFQLQDPGVQLGDSAGDLVVDLRDAGLPLPGRVLHHTLGRGQEEDGEAAETGGESDNIYDISDISAAGLSGAK